VPNPAYSEALAEFVGRRLDPASLTRPKRLPALTLAPAAHQHGLLEHVVLSALIIERRRMSRIAESL
jgi:hypothetical protein